MFNDKQKFTDILNKKNLHYISLYVENKKEITLNDFTLLHIEELTFEEDNPRKEALENILSAIKIDGINLVYLLLGNSDGISIYFGIVKDTKHTAELILDVDDIGKDILKPSIEGNFRGSKVSLVKGNEKKDILNSIKSMKRFGKVTGVPSINIDKEDFQGVDRLIDIMSGDDFGLMVLADPLSIEEIEEIEYNLHEAYNKISPYSKYSLQTSNGETKTEGENFSETKGTSKGYSESYSLGNSYGISYSKSKNDNSKSSQETTNEGGSENHTDSFNKGKSFSRTKGNSSSLATNSGSSESREFSNKKLNEWLIYIDEILLKRLDYGKNRGIFNMSVYLFANTNGTLLKLGNTVNALFSGSEENKATLEFSYLDNRKNAKEIKAISNLQISKIKVKDDSNNIALRTLFSSSYSKLANWVSVSDLSIITGLPQKEVVGLPLKEEIEFGLNVSKPKKGKELLLGDLVKSGVVLNKSIFLDKDVINKHIFITGVTGSGKTTTCQRVLSSANAPFMVIEPAKTEYRVLTKKYDDILIFTLGNDTIAPFRLNPFEFFKGENISSRVDMIKASIEAAFDMEAAIPQIIESALYECYEDYGWDIATSTNSKFDDPFADSVYAFPTFSDLIAKTEEVTKKQGFDDRLKNDYIGSIKARLQSLIVGSKGLMLDVPRSIDFKNLVEKNVILELEEIKNGAEKSLIIGFVLISLNEAIKQKHKEYQSNNKEFKHITLIEEAHRLLAKFTPGENPTKKLAVESFADMLAEVRKYGESLIIVDQIPNKLTPEVLKNTNTKIVHRLFASDDKDAIGNTMALDNEQKEFLSNLDVGRAIVFSQGFSKPVQVQIKELDNISTTKEKEIEESKIRELALKYYAQHYKRGVLPGLELNKEQPSIEDVDTLLKLKIVPLLKGWQEIMTNFDLNKSDFKVYIERNKLQNSVSLLAKVIAVKLYKGSKDVEKYATKFFIEIQQNKDSLTREEIAYFRLNGKNKD